MSGRGPFPQLLRSLRFRLAVTGFLTAYAPTLVLLVIGVALSGEVQTDVTDAVTGEGLATTVETTSGIPLPLVALVAAGFAPFAALLAWRWSGRALQPISEAVTLQERLIEETSHELRTPLAVLSNNAQVLLQHPDPSLEVYRQGLERSEAVAKRMTDTIDTLLVDTRGRARTIGRVPTDLIALTTGVIERLSGLADRNGVGLDLVGQGPVSAAVDGESVERAITNLVTNAVQHAPNGSRVTIEVNRRDRLAEIIVTDRGPGIPPEAQARVFERYWRTEHDGEDEGVAGAGIGLAIVRHVAIAHGGAVTVTSPVDDRPGARFRLTLVAE